MIDILEKMDPDKRMRLINCAMDEFGENRFDKASTNTIVKNAGISKGLLFHYFESKEALYQYLVEFAIKSVAEPIANEVGIEDRDIIRRIRKITELKVGIINKFPSLLRFSNTMFIGKDYDEIKKMIQKYHTIPIEHYFAHNIDETLFKEGIDIPTAIKTVQFTLERISERLVQQRNMGFETDIDNSMNEVNHYLEHFRSIYYKEEAQ